MLAGYVEAYAVMLPYTASKVLEGAFRGRATTRVQRERFKAWLQSRVKRAVAAAEPATAQARKDAMDGTP